VLDVHIGCFHENSLFLTANHAFNILYAYVLILVLGITSKFKQRISLDWGH